MEHGEQQMFVEEQTAQIKLPRDDYAEQRRCDFCGADLSSRGLVGSERRKYCSKSCQSRASQGRIKARLAARPSKRYATRLKFSDPLYFN
jgi:hypothetical protein